MVNRIYERRKNELGKLLSLDTDFIYLSDKQLQRIGYLKQYLKINKESN